MSILDNKMTDFLNISIKQRLQSNLPHFVATNVGYNRVQ